MTRSIACLEDHNKMRNSQNELVDEWMMQSPQVYSHIVDMAKMRLGSLTTTTDTSNDDVACYRPISVPQPHTCDQSASTRQFERVSETSALNMEEEMFFGSPPGLPMMTPERFQQQISPQNVQSPSIIRPAAQATSPSFTRPAPQATSPVRMSPQHTMSPEEWALLSDLSDALAAPSSHRAPPMNYVCHCCYQGGHYIRDCPKRRAQETSGVYQGNRQSVGKFKCDNCRHEWTSKKCYALCVQKCRKCTHSNMPKKMYSMSKALEMGLINVEDMDME